MRFSLFVHMERYDPAKSQHELLAELVELVQVAEAGGFEAAWVGEHHGMEYTIAPNPFAFMAYLAPQTTTIRLGTGTLIAPFWHPLRLAGEAAVVDLMSNGRLELGIARGAYQFEFDRLAPGMPATEGGKALRELVPAVRALWQGDYAHEGEVWRFPASTSAPKPLQAAGPPIWIAARDPLTHAFAVEQGADVMVTPLAKPDAEVERLVGIFDGACAANPDVPRPRLLLLRHAWVGASEAEIDRGVQALRRFYATFEGWFRNEGNVVDGFCPPIPDAELAERPDYAPDVVRASHLVGSPDEVIARLKAYEALGVDQFSLWIDNSLGHADKRRMLDLWVDEVLPAFA